jgi:hypothetical protein
VAAVPLQNIGCRKTYIALNRSAVGERAATTSTAMWIIFLGDDCLI